MYAYRHNRIKEWWELYPAELEISDFVLWLKETLPAPSTVQYGNGSVFDARMRRGGRWGLYVPNDLPEELKLMSAFVRKVPTAILFETADLGLLRLRMNVRVSSKWD